MKNSLNSIIQTYINTGKTSDVGRVSLYNTNVAVENGKLMVTTLSEIPLYPDDRFFSQLTTLDLQALRFSNQPVEGTAGGTRMQIATKESGLEIYKHPDGATRIRKLSPRIPTKITEIAVNGTTMEVQANGGTATKNALAYKIDGKYYKLDSSTPSTLTEVADPTEAKAIQDKIQAGKRI